MDSTCENNSREKVLDSTFGLKLPFVILHVRTSLSSWTYMRRIAKGMNDLKCNGE